MNRYTEQRLRAPRVDDRPSGQDALTVFFDAPVERAYEQADRVAQVIEQAAGYPDGRWRLEPFGRGWVMSYRPFDREWLRDVEAAVARRFGGAVSVREGRPRAGLREASRRRAAVWSPSFERTGHAQEPRKVGVTADVEKAVLAARLYHGSAGLPIRVQQRLYDRKRRAADAVRRRTGAQDAGEQIEREALRLGPVMPSPGKDY